MCNSNITNIKDIIILDNEQEFQHTDGDNIKAIATEEIDKMENFKNLVDKMNQNTRLLIFSEYDASFNQRLQILDENNLKYSKIMGTSAHINSVVQKYKAGEIQCLLSNDS